MKENNKSAVRNGLATAVAVGAHAVCPAHLGATLKTLGVIGVATGLSAPRTVDEFGVQVPTRFERAQRTIEHTVVSSGANFFGAKPQTVASGYHGAMTLVTVLSGAYLTRSLYRGLRSALDKGKSPYRSDFPEPPIY